MRQTYSQIFKKNSWPLIVSILIAIVCLSLALIIGLTSHSVHYRQYKPDGRHRLELYYLEDRSKYYIYLGGTHIYYAITPRDFLSKLDGSLNDETFNKATGLSYLIYEDSASSIDAYTENGKQRVAGDEYQVGKVAFFDANGKEHIYTSKRYEQNPDGFSINNWYWSLLIVGIGVILIALLYLRTRFKKSSLFLQPQPVEKPETQPEAIAETIMPATEPGSFIQHEEPGSSTQLQYGPTGAVLYETATDPAATLRYAPEQVRQDGH